MRLFHSMAKWLCLFTLVVGFVTFTGCASTSPADSEAGSETRTTEAGGESGTHHLSGAAGESDKSNSSESSPEGDPAEKNRPQQVELPQSRNIPVDQLMELVGQSVPERFIFLSDSSNNPLRIYHDLDGNGYEDIFFLLVEFPEQAPAQSEHTAQTMQTPADEPADLPQNEVKPDEPPTEAYIHNRRVAASDLADMSRLFSEEIRPHKFYLALFLRTPSGLVSMYRIPLGSWFVFEEFRGFQLSDQRPMPYAVSVAFQTHEGRKSQWVCFSSYNEFSFFALKNSISVSTETRDINSSGILDILEWRKVFEEGTGYETFLTWYKWDGKKYAQHDSTNIVRNLNQFLHSASTLLSLGKWSQVFSLVLPEDRYRELMNKNISLGTLFMRLFPSQPGRDEEVTLDDAELEAMIDREERVFNTVIFPRVLENPFAGEQQKIKPGYRTRFSIRFILRDGRSSVRECSVRMNANPFAQQQYFIEPQ